MNRAQNDAELRNLFTCPELESLLLETGYCKPLVQLTIDDRSAIIPSVTDYHCVIKVKAAMDQFIDGLDAGRVLDCIKRHPQELKTMFCPVLTTLTAGIIIIL